MANQRFVKSKTRSAQQGWLKEIEPEMQRGMDDFMQSALMRSEFTMPCGWMTGASPTLTDGDEKTVDWTSVTAAIDTDSYKANGGWTVPVGLGGKHFVFAHAVITLGDDTASALVRITDGGTEVTRTYIYNDTGTSLAIGCVGLVDLSDGDTIDLRITVNTVDTDDSTSTAYFGFVRVAD